MAQNGAPVDISLTVDLHIEKFSGGTITQLDSGATNVVYDQYEDGRWYVTQRPGINMAEDASDTVSDARGRGIFYWNDVTDKYIVNNDTVYKSSYSGTTMSLSAGTQRVYMEEVGDYLTIIDPENNEGWYIDSAASTTLTQITDTDFPSEQTPALTLARGSAELNSKLYVLTTKGDIYESDVEDPTSWGATNFRNAERDSDSGVYITKYLDHILVFGTRSGELFYDNANPTGSTLEPRLDVSYNVGMISDDACCRVGDDVYFVGQDESNSLGVYRLTGFQLVKISGEDMDTFLTTAVTVDEVSVLLSGKISGGRHFVFLTTYATPSDINPLETLVYTSTRDWWGFWDVQLTGVDLYPLVGWTSSTNTRAGEGILTTGDIVTVLDDFNPQDIKGEVRVFASGVFSPGVFTAVGASGAAIPIEVITGSIHGGTMKRKRQGDLWVVHEPIEASENITISTADDQNTTYTEAGTIDASDIEDRLNRMGSFRKRNFKLAGTFTDQIRLEKIQTTMRIG